MRNLSTSALSTATSCACALARSTSFLRATMSCKRRSAPVSLRPAAVGRRQTYELRWRSLSVFLSVCLSTCLPVSPSVCLRDCLFLSVSVCQCPLTVSPSVHPSVGFYLSACVPVYFSLPLRPSVSICQRVYSCTSLCLSVCPSVCFYLSACLPMYFSLPLHLSVRPSVSICQRLCSCPSLSIYLNT